MYNRKVEMVIYCFVTTDISTKVSQNDSGVALSSHVSFVQTNVLIGCHGNKETKFSVTP